MYVSFDGGEHWQSLRQNMPATSIRDLVIKNDDIVVGTHGRSFWILDNITPLRQAVLQKQPAALLYQPQTAYRIRWNKWTDTPLPQEEPAGENPPDGAVLDYYLPADAKNVSLDIVDAKGSLVRHYASTDTLYKTGNLNIPAYWIRPQQILSAAKGAHRWLWDLRYAPLNVPAAYPIAAVYRNTAPAETAPLVMPGLYSVKLNVDGKTYFQPLLVKMDPRVKTPLNGLQRQHDLSVQVYKTRQNLQTLLKDMRQSGQAIPIPQ